MKRILLDTHVFLWLLEAPKRLPAAWLSTFGSVETELVLSAASAWEVAQKSRLGKLELPAPPAEYVRTRCEAVGIDELPITWSHATAVAALPMHHRDPFDRMLIAQAVEEGLTIATLDSAFSKYAVRCLPVVSQMRSRAVTKVRPRTRAAAH